MKKVVAVKTVLALAISAAVWADDAEQANFFEEVTIVGNADRAGRITGAVNFLSDADLEIFEYSDVQRILRQVPGVSLQVEDGYGLRPNIAIRGVPTERSERVVLLEDGVPIAPAPYSAASAYYFPTMGRMYNIEVVKGPSAITQGPNSIGGAINFVSTPIPQQQSGQLQMEVGGDSTTRTHASYGATQDNGFGFMVETHQWKSDGYQQIDGSDDDTGLDVEDYTVKLAYAPSDSRHSVELKYQYAQQDSNQSYLGLTDGDFADDAYRRYGVSQLDNITTEHNQWILRYGFEVSDAVNLTATAYDNQHKRNWFKLNKFDVDGSAGQLGKTSWSSVISGVNSGNGITGATASDLQAILDGGDTGEGGIQFRANNRAYFSRGIQLKLDVATEHNGVAHDIELGLRYHEDEEDRLQRDSLYQQLNGALVENDEGVWGDGGNRVQEARALSAYVHDTIIAGNWVLTPGLRFESIDLERTEWSNAGRTTEDSNRSNSITAVLPGFGALYSVNDSLSVLAGVYKGLGAPTNESGIEEEEAVNYELGLRYQQGEQSAELIAFVNDYKNLVATCTASSGSNCTIGDTFNGGAAEVKGLELALNDQYQLADFAVPVALAYTYTDSSFDSSFETDFFGDVTAGDPIPYIPENQLTLSVGLERGDWALNAAVNSVDAVCVKAACGDFESTEDSTTVDLSARYRANDDLGFYARLENATDEKDIVGRQPYGARPNKARTATVGMRLAF